MFSKLPAELNFAIANYTGNRSVTRSPHVTRLASLNKHSRDYWKPYLRQEKHNVLKSKMVLKGKDKKSPWWLWTDFVQSAVDMDDEDALKLAKEYYEIYGGQVTPEVLFEVTKSILTLRDSKVKRFLIDRVILDNYLVGDLSAPRYNSKFLQFFSNQNYNVLNQLYDHDIKPIPDPDPKNKPTFVPCTFDYEIPSENINWLLSKNLTSQLQSIFEHCRLSEDSIKKLVDRGFRLEDHWFSLFSNVLILLQMDENLTLLKNQDGYSKLDLLLNNTFNIDETLSQMDFAVQYDTSPNRDIYIDILLDESPLHPRIRTFLNDWAIKKKYVRCSRWTMKFARLHLEGRAKDIFLECSNY